MEKKQKLTSSIGRQSSGGGGKAPLSESNIGSAKSGHDDSDSPARHPAASSAARPQSGVAGGTAAIADARAEHAAQMAELNSRWDDIASSLSLTAVYNAVEQMTASVDQLERTIAGLRARGYVYGRGWDAQVKTLQTRWNKQRGEAQRLVQNEQRSLQTTSTEVRGFVQRAASNASLVGAASTRLYSFQNTISETQRNIIGAFDETAKEAGLLNAQMERVNFLLDSLDSASFDLFPDEAAVAACKAQWVSDQQKPIGILFLTDGRLIFEQREERATKKILFITTEKEMIQEKLWETPVGAVAETRAEDKSAFFSSKEMLILHFETRTRELPGDVTLELQDGATNEEWVSLIKRVKNGQIAGDRVGQPGAGAPAQSTAPGQPTAPVAPPPDAPAKPLPTKCPTCNAPLPTIYKGMRQVSCEYCGAVINIE